jgi:hypothetical protein
VNFEHQGHSPVPALVNGWTEDIRTCMYHICTCIYHYDRYMDMYVPYMHTWLRKPVHLTQDACTPDSGCLYTWLRKPVHGYMDMYVPYMYMYIPLWEDIRTCMYRICTCIYHYEWIYGHVCTIYAHLTREACTCDTSASAATHSPW